MRVYYFNITYRCNSNCIFCAADHPLLQEENEMSIEEFERILQANHVGMNDRVIINGGEPTVHPDFFGFLNAVHKRGATIDLFSNGMRFCNEEFTQKVMAYRNIYIRIPLFGATADMHDKLTGCHGGFAAVTRGLDNICKHLTKGTDLEIKMLLCKVLVKENETIYSLVNSRWRNERVRLSLNPLLISNCVIQQKELFVDTYENMMRESESLIRRISSDGWQFSLDLVPYCTFPSNDLIALCHGNTILDESFYADPRSIAVIDEMKGRELCMKCRYARKCNGFPESYVAYFGTEVMKPIT